MAASELIEAAGFSTCDDILHGITKEGFERMHCAPWGFLRVG